jgi:hypothetical protein
MAGVAHLSDGAESMLGWRAREVGEELPGLQLLICEARRASGRTLSGASPPEVRERLRELSNRFRGARAVAIRREPVPSAYRVFFRHVGLEPDIARTPIEAALLERMLNGGFPTRGLLEDVLLTALLDTGVPVWALDAQSLDGRLGIRVTHEGERLGRMGDGPVLPPGRLVIADSSAAIAVLFGELAPGHEARAGTHAVTLFAVQVAGVPTLFVEEALWSCRASLERL